MLSACGCMGRGLRLFRANVGALNVLLGTLSSFPVNLSLSLCFSGHVICSLAALLFLLLTPLWTLTSCRPHVDLWPTSLSFIFLRLVVHFLYFFSLENPAFLSVHSVTNNPHTDCYSAPTGRGEVTLALSHCFCLCSSPYFVFPLLFCCPSFIFSHSVLSLFSHLFLSWPHWLHVHEGWISSLISPCVCMNTLGWGAGVTLAFWSWRLKHCISTQCCLTERRTS